MGVAGSDRLGTEHHSVSGRPPSTSVPRHQRRTGAVVLERCQRATWPMAGEHVEQRAHGTCAVSAECFHHREMKSGPF